jgi:hypothetical protein
MNLPNEFHKFFTLCGFVFSTSTSLFHILFLLVIHWFLFIYDYLGVSSLNVDISLVFHHNTSKLEESLHHQRNEFFHFP